jgi:hypothetical protein
LLFVGDIRGAAVSRVDPDINAIVKQYKQATSWIVPVAGYLHNETQIERIEPSGTSVKGNRVEDIRFFHDNGKLDISWNSRLIDDEGNVDLHQSYKEQCVATDRLFRAKEFFDEKGYRGFVRNTTREDTREVFSQEFGTFLEGDVGGMEPGAWAADMLSENPKLVGEEVVQGSKCYMVESQTAQGTLRAWISPEKGWNCCRLILAKTGQDRWRDGKSLQEAEIKEWSVTVEDVQIEKIGDVYIPVAGTFTQKAVFKDGSTKTTQVKVKRSKIELHSNFEALGAFRINVPNGTPVSDQDFPGIVYEVRDGQLVLVTSTNPGRPQSCPSSQRALE